MPDVVDAGAGRSGQREPKPSDPVFATTEFKLIARPADAFRAAEAAVRAAGYECVMLGDRIEGEARDVAADHAGQALALQRQGRRAVILSGGELTVTIRGQGRGGPNQEYALALAMALDGAPGIAALAGDTDGTDGGAGSADDPAGAVIDATTLPRARGARPRSGPFSFGQRFHGVFQPARRPGRNRADLDQRERFSRHRR